MTTNVAEVPPLDKLVVPDLNQSQTNITSAAAASSQDEISEPTQTTTSGSGQESKTPTNDDDEVTIVTDPVLLKTTALCFLSPKEKRSMGFDCEKMFIPRECFSILKQLFGVRRSDKVRRLIFPYVVNVKLIYASPPSSSSSPKTTATKTSSSTLSIPKTRHLWNQIHRQALKILIAQLQHNKSDFQLNSTDVAWVQRAVDDVKRCDEELSHLLDYAVPVLLHLSMVLTYVLQNKSKHDIKADLRDYLQQYTLEQLEYMVYLLRVSNLYCVQLHEENMLTVTQQQAERMFWSRLHEHVSPQYTTNSFSSFPKEALIMGAGFVAESCRESVHDALINAKGVVLAKVPRRIQKICNWIEATYMTPTISVRIQ